MVDIIITVISIIGASLLSALRAYQRRWGRIVCGGLLVLPLAAAWERTVRFLGAELTPTPGTALFLGLSALGLVMGHALVRRWAEGMAGAGTYPQGARAYRSQVRREARQRVRVVTRKEHRR